MTDYYGLAANYSYTARGELATITAPGGKVWTFAYNALGQRTQYTHPNGIRTEYGYDTQNRLASILHKDATTNAVLDGFTYTLNDGGNLTRIDHADGSYWTYAYDNRDRLTGAMRRNSQDGILHLYGYNYDNADNMTQWGRYQTSDDRTDIWAYTYNAGNQQLTMTLNGGTAETRTYDDLGRLATRVQGSYSASYAYRYASRLYQATSNFPGESNVTLNYGADGKLRTRTTATETRRYRYDRGWNPVIEEVGGATVATNFFEPGAPVGQVLAQAFGTASAYTVYASHDHLATVRHWRWANKNSAVAFEYEPYGNLYARSTTVNLPRIFALHEFDTSLQQYRAPYRNYSPTMARWTTMDPAGMVDGPNMYGYTRAKPITNIDSLGLAVWVCNRKTQWGIGNHAYFWDDSTNTSCGTGSTGGGEKGPPTDECNKIEGSESKIVTWLLMKCCQSTADLGPWLPFVNDCHSAVKRCTKVLGLTYPGAPGGRLGQPTDESCCNTNYRRWSYGT